LEPLFFEANTLHILDQTRLPEERSYITASDHARVADAIRNLSIRGAPAIGVAAGYGIALGALQLQNSGKDDFLKGLDRIIESITSTRPTARNLFQVAERMRLLASRAATPSHARAILLAEAKSLHSAQKEQDLDLSRYGAELIPPGATVLTHCNTGSLATGGYGTALGAIKLAHEQGKRIHVLATETRPLLQGARLTAFELEESGVPFHLIADSAAGYFIAKGEVQLVITGADRIALNGDTANKIGTFTIATLAGQYKVPFYIAAPFSTFDPATKTGEDIKIEERSPEELTRMACVRVAPAGVHALNPAFDVTPARLITALVTERGIFQPEELSRQAIRLL